MSMGCGHWWEMFHLAVCSLVGIAIMELALIR
jgi:hypothetical protein